MPTESFEWALDTDSRCLPWNLGLILHRESLRSRKEESKKQNACSCRRVVGGIVVPLRQEALRHHKVSQSGYLA